MTKLDLFSITIVNWIRSLCFSDHSSTTIHLFWHLTEFGSVHHFGGLILLLSTPSICRWTIYKNVFHMWPVVESGLDLMIAPLAIWSVGWIMPPHQILSTPDMSSAAVTKRGSKKQKNKQKTRETERQKDLWFLIIHRKLFCFFWFLFDQNNYFGYFAET